MDTTASPNRFRNRQNGAKGADVGRLRTAGGIWRAGLIALAFMALFVRVITPQGFMVADTHGAGGFPLVICTGHGPLMPGGSDKAPGHSHTDGVCAFAGHAAAPPPPLVRTPASTLAAYVQPSSQRVAYLAPGLGLAAPPPPSHAPPQAI